MAFIDEEKSSRQLFPTQRLRFKLSEVSKAAISKSLCELVGDLDELLGNLPSLCRDISLDQVSIAVQLTTEGGVAWVAQASTGMSNSMTLTFKVQRSKGQ
jgi:hypothetical protein